MKTLLLLALAIIISTISIVLCLIKKKPAVDPFAAYRPSVGDTYECCKMMTSTGNMGIGHASGLNATSDTVTIVHFGKITTRP